MAQLAIKAEGLSKQYRIGELNAPYDTLREHIVRASRALVGRGRRGRSEPRTIWALDGVDFEVEQGEVVGLIGPNGAGKTTLLKVLSRITEPTRGYADVRGRIGSLLEVGTGFHPELTGRENIFLNGAIIGMRRSEVARKFDDIVAFGGIERFIDTPVKRYSSGMYVRLAFAVAAHLETEILLVDEVLAVGDAEFQKRCLGKIEEIGETGRTVLYVSHNMSTITRLCDRAILLEAGRIREDGAADQVVAHYLSGAYGTSAERIWAADEAPQSENVRLRSVRVVDSNLNTTESIDVREPVGIEFVFDILRDDCPAFVPWMALYNEQGVHVFSAMDIDPAWRRSRPSGRYRSVAWIGENLLNEGAIVASLSLNTFAPSKAMRQAHVDSALTFQVVDPGEGDTARGHYAGAWPGPVRPLLEWRTEYAADPSELLEPSATR